MLRFEDLATLIMGVTVIILAILYFERSDVDEYFKRRKYTNTMKFICILVMIIMAILFVYQVILGYEGIYIS